MLSYNITEGLEAEEYSWSNTKPRTMTGTSTGESETLTFTGSVLAMKSLAQKYLNEGYDAASGGGMQVSCAVNRDKAGMATLRVTRAWYGAAESEDPEGGSGDTPPASAAGTSESCPCRTVSLTDVQVPILAHSLIQSKGYDPRGATMIALRMYSKGAGIDEPFSVVENGQTVVKTVGEGLAGADTEVIALVAAQEYFLDEVITVTDKYELPEGSKMPDFGDYPKIQAPPFAPNLTGDRNWLYCGGEVTREGDRIMVSKIYKASDVNGWNPNAYSS